MNDEKQAILEQDQAALEMEKMNEEELVLALGGGTSNKEWQE
jgi:hypothetical protein